MLSGDEAREISKAARAPNSHATFLFTLQLSFSATQTSYPSTPHQMMTKSSTTLVLTTPELLISILSYLPFQDVLLHITLVSRKWRDTILSTPSLLRILHMHPLSNTPTSLHPFLLEKELFPLYLQFPRHEQQHPELVSTSNEDNESGEKKVRSKLEKFAYEGASWRRMLVFTGSPVVKRARIREMIQVGAEAAWYERTSAIYFASGFRLDDLYSLCENRWTRRMQPLQSIVRLKWMRGGKKRSCVFRSEVVDNTEYEGGGRGVVGWWTGVRERRRENKGRKKRDQMGLEMVGGVEYGRVWGGAMGEEECEVELLMERAWVRWALQEEFRPGLDQELVRKGFRRFLGVVEED